MHNRAVIAVIGLLTVAGCASTSSAPKQTIHKFPDGQAFVEEIERPFKRMGTVRSKVDYPTLDPNWEEPQLCRNYYNKAVSDLVKFARDKGADAVIEVRSVVFYEGGKTETHKTAECSDDGREGQVLAQGVAVKWLKQSPPAPVPAPVPAPTPTSGAKKPRPSPSQTSTP